MENMLFILKYIFNISQLSKLSRSYLNIIYKWQNILQFQFFMFVLC